MTVHWTSRISLYHPCSSTSSRTSSTSLSLSSRGGGVGRRHGRDRSRRVRNVGTSRISMWRSSCSPCGRVRRRGGGSGMRVRGCVMGTRGVVMGLRGRTRRRRDRRRVRGVRGIGGRRMFPSSVRGMSGRMRARSRSRPGDGTSRGGGREGASRRGRHMFLHSLSGMRRNRRRFVGGRLSGRRSLRNARPRRGWREVIPLLSLSLLPT
mmetsp:Transcript_14649/g.14747  ORF Transcript_14649/g.14747 Transcript_14649/m.14747 type:complete len:208 (+) Transcript_14649:838-1461(+)